MKSVGPVGLGTEVQLAAFSLQNCPDGKPSFVNCPKWDWDCLSVSFSVSFSETCFSSPRAVRSNVRAVNGSLGGTSGRLPRGGVPYRGCRNEWPPPRWELRDSKGSLFLRL